MRQRRGCFANLLFVAVFSVVVLYGVIAVTDPWAFHIGGRWTPLLTWRGTGKLLTKSGIEYPLYVTFYPSSHFSQLRMDGVRPTGGVQGSGWLCISPGVTESLELTGTVYGVWRTTEGSLMGFRLLERKIFDMGQSRGFFDLVGRWRGPELAMDDRGNIGSPFRSGVRIEHASVTFSPSSYSEFKAACASAKNLPALPTHR